MESLDDEYQGINNGTSWTCQGKLDNNKTYNIYLQTDNRLIGNAELRMLDSNSYDDLDSHYIWYFLSDLFIYTEFRRKGFGKILIEKVKNIARINEVAIVKRVKTTQRTEHKLDDLIHFLTSNGFKIFDDKTFYYTHDERELE